MDKRSQVLHNVHKERMDKIQSHMLAIVDLLEDDESIDLMYGWGFSVYKEQPKHMQLPKTQEFDLLLRLEQVSGKIN